LKQGGTMAEVKVTYNNSRGWWIGRNGRAKNGGLLAFRFSHELEGMVGIEMLNGRGEPITGGGVMPVEALDEFCKAWLRSGNDFGKTPELMKESEYVKGNGRLCPRCGADHVLSQYDHSFEGSTGKWDMRCEECGYYYQDLFVLVGYSE
jgi:hypothetical protein